MEIYIQFNFYLNENATLGVPAGIEAAANGNDSGAVCFDHS
jgi:hypothetical protein